MVTTGCGALSGWPQLSLYLVRSPSYINTWQGGTHSLRRADGGANPLHWGFGIKSLTLQQTDIHVGISELICIKKSKSFGWGGSWYPNFCCSNLALTIWVNHTVPKKNEKETQQRLQMNPPTSRVLSLVPTPKNWPTCWRNWLWIWAQEPSLESWPCCVNSEETLKQVGFVIDFMSVPAFLPGRKSWVS